MTDEEIQAAVSDIMGLNARDIRATQVFYLKGESKEIRVNVSLKPTVAETKKLRSLFRRHYQEVLKDS